MSSVVFLEENENYQIQDNKVTKTPITVNTFC